MRRLDLTLPTPEENLALDEALLDWAEDEDPEGEFLRLWESPRPLVVIGRSSRLHQEVHEPGCRARDIPVLRRSSGGAAIVAGPGCLMYAVVLSYALRPELKDIRAAHGYVLGRLANSLWAHGLAAEHAGTSDLVIADCGFRIADWDRRSSQSAIRNPKSTIRKFSGNSLRAKRSHLLYHGTLLYDFDLSLVQACLRMPPRQPEYRAERGHREFLVNVPLERRSLMEAVDAAWPTGCALIEWPVSRVAALVAERFSRESWNFEFV